MSACVVLRQKHAVHLISDSATYNPDGVVCSVSFAKCIALPAQSAAVCWLGPVFGCVEFSHYLANSFADFEEIIGAGAAPIAEHFLRTVEALGLGEATGQLYVIGWLTKQNRPAAFHMHLWTDNCRRIETLKERATEEDLAALDRFVWHETEFSGSPIPPEATRLAAGFFIPRNLERVDPEIDLLHFIETQRRDLVDDGNSLVGGKAVLTSISGPGEIRQRVIRHWPEDVVGQKIVPLPIADWQQWRKRLKADRRR